MVKRVRPSEPSIGLRERLAQDLEARVAARPSDPHLAGVLQRLREGEDVILPGWQLHRYRVPAVRRGVHAYYLIDLEGTVRELTRSDLIRNHGWDLR